MIRKLLLPFLLAFTIPASADLPGLTAPARFGYDVPCRASLGKRGIPTTKSTMETKANHMWWGRFAAVAAAALVSFLALPASAALRARFWDVFVADALLGNFDRHNGNWGFLVDPATGAAEPAPVFDCGSCLLPQADEETMRRVLADPAEMDARIYVFPASMLKLGGRKINYADFLANSRDPDLAAARARIVPRIDTAAFARLLAETPYLSDLQRDFYPAYFSARASKLFGV